MKTFLILLAIVVLINAAVAFAALFTSSMVSRDEEEWLKSEGGEDVR